MGTSRRVVALAVPVVAISLIATACGGSNNNSGSGGNNNNTASPSPSGSKSPGGASKSPSGASKSPSGSKSPGGASKSPGGGSSPAPSSTKLVDINATPYADVKDGGTWNTAIDQFSTQWNYWQTNGAEASTVAVVAPMLPEAMKTTANGTFEPDPNYVKSATSSTVGGKQTVTYELNPSAKWSDGSPVNWKDYAALATALSGKNPAYQIGTSTGYDQIASVKEGKNQFEVIVTFATPFGEWKSLFPLIYPAKIIGTPKGFNSGYLNKIPMTAGPFKLGSMDKSAQVITDVRDPNWWGRKPKLDKINLRVLTAEATPGAFSSGEIDDIDVGPDPNAYAQAKKVKGVSIHITTGPNFRLLNFNGRQGAILGDVKLRQAIAMGLDRNAIANSDLKGLPYKSSALNNHFYIPGQKGFQDNAGKLGVYNPQAAMALIESAGWKREGTYFKKGGKELDVKLVIPAQVPVSANEAQLITPMLAAIGIKVKLVTAPSNDFFDKYIQPGKYDLTVYSWLGGAAPISGNAPLFLSPAKSGQNYSGFGTPEMDAALKKALQTVDPAEAIKAANEADKVVFQNMPMLPLYQRPNIHATQHGLVNVGATAFQSTDWTTIGFKK